ncbi:MAG TPA: membrane dipeptidase, partial [Verrucomicrobiae bacterium]|nr:membrane dipeptidase [Verrucomicrobiae bacterium]
MLNSTTADWGISEKAAALHASALVWDDHGGFAFSKPSILADLERWRAAGIDYLSINAGYDVVPWTETLEAVSKYRHWIRTHPATLVQVETVDDILRARSQGKLAVTFDLEGMNALNGDIGMVDLYYRLGVRQMLFAYNRNNLAGGGCHDEDIGLSEFGREVIAEMNRVGMVVDCS